MGMANKQALAVKGAAVEAAYKQALKMRVR